MTYFIISQSDDGELPPSTATATWPVGLWIIRGELVVPIPKQVVTEYDLP